MMLKGINIIGFSITGKPNRTGSLMLNKPGTAPISPTALICLLLAKIIIASSRDRVAPTVERCVHIKELLCNNMW